MKSWDSSSIHSHFALIIKAQCFWLQTLLRKDEQNTFAFLNTISVKQWSLKKSSYTMFPPICSLQISSRRTLENKNSKREEMLSDSQDSRHHKMNIEEECRKSWYFLFESSYPDIRFQSHFHMISFLRYSYYEGLDPYLWHHYDIMGLDSYLLSMASFWHHMIPLSRYTLSANDLYPSYQLSGLCIWL